MATKNDDLNERVATAIQAQLLAILPEEEIRARVDQVIENYFTPTKVNDYGRTTVNPSKFAKQVEEILNETIGAQLRTLFASDNWKYKLNEKNEVVMGESLKKVLNIHPDALIDTAADIVAKRNMHALLMLISAAAHNTGQNQFAHELTSMNISNVGIR